LGQAVRQPSTKRRLEDNGSAAEQESIWNSLEEDADLGRSLHRPGLRSPRRRAVSDQLNREPSRPARGGI